MTIPTVQELSKNFMDVTAPDTFEIEVQKRNDGTKVVYINIDDVTVFRACRVKEIKVKGMARRRENNG